MSLARVIRGYVLTAGCGFYTLWGALIGNFWVWCWAGVALVMAAISLHRDLAAHLDG